MRDIDKIKSGQTDDSIAYQSVTGIDVKAESDENGVEEKGSDDDDDEGSSSDDDGEGEGEEEGGKFSSSHRPRDESPNSKRERKKAVKAK